MPNKYIKTDYNNKFIFVPVPNEILFFGFTN